MGFSLINEIGLLLILVFVFLDIIYLTPISVFFGFLRSSIGGMLNFNLSFGEESLAEECTKLLIDEFSKFLL